MFLMSNSVSIVVKGRYLGFIEGFVTRVIRLDTSLAKEEGSKTLLRNKMSFEKWVIVKNNIL